MVIGEEEDQKKAEEGGLHSPRAGLIGEHKEEEITAKSVSLEKYAM